MKFNWLMREQLDHQLLEWQSLGKKYPRPRIGWIKTLRNALGFTGTQLAKRLGVKRARISQLEQAEVQGTVSLNTLKNVADVLDCELIYVIVPKSLPNKNRTLEDILKERAGKMVEERMKRVGHTMALENQAVSKPFLKTQQHKLIKSFLSGPLKKLWEDND